MSLLNIATVMICQKHKGTTQILLLNRDKSPYQDIHAFPGGKVEQGETLKTAAMREIREETGLNLADVNLLAIVNEQYFEDKVLKDQFVLYYFSATVDPNQCLKPTSEGQVEWYSVDQIPDDLVPSDYKILQLYQQQQLGKEIKHFECKLLADTTKHPHLLRLDSWEEIP